MRVFTTGLGVIAMCLPLAAQDQADPFPADRPPLFDPEFKTMEQDPELVRLGLIVASDGAEQGGVGMKCMSCHGIEGMGARTGGIPRLAGLSAKYLEEQLNAFRKETRASDIMTPIALGLSEGEMSAVAAYYASLDAQSLESFPEVDQDVVQRGGALAASGITGEDREVTACTSCHVNTEDRSDNGVPMLAAQHATYIQSQLKAWKDGMRRNDPLNVMKTIAEKLTEEEIEAVGLYYERLAPE